MDERKSALDKIMNDKSGLIDGYEKKMDEMTKRMAEYELRVGSLEAERGRL